MHWGDIRRFRRETPALVALVPSRRDWRIINREHWYRIPVASAPENLQLIRWLGFYFPAAFGAERWSVGWLARVTNLSVVRRIDLLPAETDHPRATTPYWRIALTDIAPLPRPIPSARRRRIVFIPTSLERLRSAQEINDLYRTSPIEDRLYHRLCAARARPERQFFVRDGDSGYFIDLALLCRNGRLAVECDGDHWHANTERAGLDRRRDNSLTAAGWHILRFSGREINRNADDCLRLVLRTVARLNGLRPAQSEAAGRPAGRSNCPATGGSIRKTTTASGARLISAVISRP